MFIDSHCHLSFPELSGRIDEVRRAMALARVDGALVICTTIEEFDTVHGLAMQHDNFWATVGVHPDSEGGAEPSAAELVRLAGREKVVGIGETGLDYYRLGGRTVEDMEWQRERFRTHIRAARTCRLPLVVHTRSAPDDMLAILRDEQADRVGGVFHCFTESLDVARSALELGFMIGFSGIVTFRNAEALRDVLRFVPLECCLIETDSPYLAPVPHRGRSNQPAWVVHVAEQVASVKGVALAEVARVTSDNFARLFGRVSIP